ncbi:MAG: ATP-grasp domain-containing protein [Candidatus Magnetoovum sp. WYHC-5]|nr:ATP-grasp domain-containing protein [Candidatus Magnetoovum sp. WYHC-5]
MNILITSASRKVSLVNSFKEAILKEGYKGKVYAADISPLSPALYSADECLLLPASASPGFIKKVIELCLQKDIKLLIPTRDEELPLFAYHKDTFTKAGVTVMVGSSETVNLCQNKAEFIDFCKKNGFLVPKVYSAYDINGDVPFPLFIKPCVGKGGRFTRVVNNKLEIEAALMAMPDAIIQEYLDLPEYTIDVFCNFKGDVISVVPRERINVFGGESFTGCPVNNPVLIEEAVRIAKTLKLIGHNTIQCFWDGYLVKFIEVNPRFGGGAILSIKAGLNSPGFLIRLIAQEEVLPCIGEFTNNLYMLRYVEDVFVEKEALIAC